MSDVLSEHLCYLELPYRAASFQTALKRHLPPNAVVLDAGCGTGVLGLYCLQAGAQRVYAVDSTAAIELAQQSYQRAGLASRAQFIRGSTFQAVLPEKVDAVICDHVGFFGVDYGIVDLLADARHRLLKPGGLIIPGLLRLQVAAVQSEDMDRTVRRWSQPDIPAEFHWIETLSTHNKRSVLLTADQLLTPACTLGDIDLRVDQPAFHRWTVQTQAERNGTVHGVAGWFEYLLAGEVWMTNSPLSPQSIGRPQAFLPLDTPLAVQAGDEITIEIMMRPADHLIAWTVRHPRSGTESRQSTWQGDIVEQDRLKRLHPARQPVPSAEALARQTVLGYCDGTRTVAQIQQLVLAEHPDLRPSAAEIQRFVAAVISQDTQ